MIPMNMELSTVITKKGFCPKGADNLKCDSNEVITEGGRTGIDETVK